MPITPPL